MNRVVRALALALILLAVLFTPALAITNPDSGPTIGGIYVYRHCLETDDMLVLVQYHINYTANPDETINEAFLGRFMNGTTELANVAPYSYYDMGYDHGIFSMYLSASEAPAWEGSYSVRLEGNPTLDWPGDPPGTISTTLKWHSTTTSAATEILLSGSIINVANKLSNYWSVALTIEVADGTVLSSYGEQYFVNSIPNLRTMCTDIFTGAVEEFEYEPVEYTQSYGNTLSNRWTGTMTGSALDNLAEWTTLPLTVVKSLLWFVVVILIAYFAALATKDLRPALFLALPLIPLGNLLGMLSLTFTAIGALMCILALAYALFYQKASG